MKRDYIVAAALRSRLYDFVMATIHQTERAMQIGEVAKRSSLTVDAIRFYEKRKLLPKAVRSAGRFRLYGEGTIERLHFIQQMQGLDFSLREVGELIQLRERKVDACARLRERPFLNSHETLARPSYGECGAVRFVRGQSIRQPAMTHIHAGAWDNLTVGCHPH